jgi:hypothetical protein
MNDQDAWLTDAEANLIYWGTEVEPVIQERTPGEKAAYAQGHRAGWQGALGGISRGKTPEQVRQLGEALHRLLEDSTSARALEPSPHRKQ